jgi:2-keto-3-deoxy-L-arabinonate dehydratase
MAGRVNRRNEDRVMTFDGVRPVLHVPFGPGPDEPVQHPELRALVRAMLDADVRGLVVLGLASEAWALREPERDEILATVADELAGRLPFVVGIEGSTQVAVARARAAARAGAAGLMVLPPSTARSADALARHFTEVAEASALPILVQDSPQVTGVTLTIDGLLTLARAHSLIQAVKIEVAGAGAKVSGVRSGGMEVVAGWGGLQYLESVERGAVGCMPGCDLGPAFVEIDRLAREGSPTAAAAAHALYDAILPLLSYEAQSLDLLLLAAKRHLRRRGVFGSERLRQPGRALDAVESAWLDRLIDALGERGVPGFATEVVA